MDFIYGTLKNTRQDIIISEAVHFASPLTALLEPTLGPHGACITAMTATVFAPLFALAYIFFGMIGQTGFRRAEMSSTVPSFVHGSVTILVAAIQMYQHFVIGPADIDADNSTHHVQLLLFSCAYFLSDVVVYLIPFARHEYLFFFHHWLVASYMMLSLQIQCGAVSAIAMILLGEFTSPFQNVWFILKALRYDHQWADDAFAYVSWMYSVFYIFVRAVIGPTLVIATVYQVYLSTKIPLYVRSYWMFAMMFTLLGSQIWVKKIAVRLFHPYKPAYNTTSHPKED